MTLTPLSRFMTLMCFTLLCFALLFSPSAAANTNAAENTNTTGQNEQSSLYGQDLQTLIQDPFIQNIDWLGTHLKTHHRIFQVSTRNYQWYYDRSQALFNAGEYKRMIWLSQRIIEGFRINCQTRHLQAIAQMNTQQFNIAMTNMKFSSRCFKDKPQFWAARGLSAIGAGKTDQARNALASLEALPQTCKNSCPNPVEIEKAKSLITEALRFYRAGNRT